MTELVPKTFNFSLALVYLCENLKHQYVASAIGVAVSTLTDLKTMRSVPKAPVGLTIINLAHDELDDAQFKECLK